MRWLREPLIQFALLGGVLFIAVQVTQHEHRAAEREIVIDAGLPGRLAYAYENQMGRTPTAIQLERLIDEHVRLEVLAREAKRVGLDRDDEIIRRRLAQKLDFLLRDTVAIQEPSEQELHAYYKEHLGQFRRPAAVSFSQVYFTSESNDGSGVARAERVLHELHQSPDTAAARSLGDRFPLQYEYDAVTLDDATRIFGHTRVADALFEVRAHEWAGPFQSGYGWHLVYVTSRRPADVQAFTDVKESVREAYLAAKREAQNAARYDEIKTRYVVTRLDGQTTG